MFADYIYDEIISLYNLVVYKIPYRRARAWPSARASKGIVHTNNLALKTFFNMLQH